MASEFGVQQERAKAFDSTTAMAIAVGIDALRDAGIPLVLTYKTTTTGGKLPDRWRLPDELRDDTGIIFASAFPGQLTRWPNSSGEFYTESRAPGAAGRSGKPARLVRAPGQRACAPVSNELDRRIAELKSLIGRTEYQFDRRFLFRRPVDGPLAVCRGDRGARGPNTQINGACASTTQAVATCRRLDSPGPLPAGLLIISADNVTSDNLVEWVGAGFLASGAAATDENVEDAATPFDRRRHGMIMGMGAAALVVESERLRSGNAGLLPICEVLGIGGAQQRFPRHPSGHRAHRRRDGASWSAAWSAATASAGTRSHHSMLFMSHETYTPARGGSASAEIHALAHRVSVTRRTRS